MTEMQGAKKHNRDRLEEMFAMDIQMENTKKPLHSLGHCWRAALLAVFRLIVMGFVSGCKPGTLPIGRHELALQS